MWRFDIKGVNPLPKERPRFGSGHGYTSKRTRVYENKIKEFVKSEIIAKNIDVNELYDKNIGIVIHFVRETKHKVDTDNLTKAVKDALQKILWIDDQFIKGECSYLTVDKKNPGFTLVVMSFEKWLQLIPAEHITGNFA